MRKDLASSLLVEGNNRPPAARPAALSEAQWGCRVNQLESRLKHRIMLLIYPKSNELNSVHDD